MLCGNLVAFLAILISSAWTDQCVEKHCACCEQGSCGNSTAPFCVGCVNGYTGPFCSDPCPTNCFNCSQFLGGAVCYKCVDGFFLKLSTGNTGNCSERCPQECRSCISEDKCTRCQDGFYKNETAQDCRYSCPERCATCWSRDDCSVCRPGYYGKTCDKTCEVGCQEQTCDINSGFCTCKITRPGQKCQRCINGKFGASCERTCPEHCVNCTNEVFCNQCETGFYGATCELLCSDGCKERECSQIDGACVNGCYNNLLHGPMCIEPTTFGTIPPLPAAVVKDNSKDSSESGTAQTVGLVLGIATPVVLILIGVGYWMFRIRKKRRFMMDMELVGPSLYRNGGTVTGRKFTLQEDLYNTIPEFMATRLAHAQDRPPQPPPRYSEYDHSRPLPRSQSYSKQVSTPVFKPSISEIGSENSKIVNLNTSHSGADGMAHQGTTTISHQDADEAVHNASMTYDSDVSDYQDPELLAPGANDDYLEPSAWSGEYSFVRERFRTLEATEREEPNIETLSEIISNADAQNETDRKRKDSHIYGTLFRNNAKDLNKTIAEESDHAQEDEESEHAQEDAESEHAQEDAESELARTDGESEHAETGADSSQEDTTEQFDAGNLINSQNIERNVLTGTFSTDSRTRSSEDRKSRPSEKYGPETGNLDIGTERNISENHQNENPVKDIGKSQNVSPGSRIYTYNPGQGSYASPQMMQERFEGYRIEGSEGIGVYFDDEEQPPSYEDVFKDYNDDNTVHKADIRPVTVVEDVTEKPMSTVVNKPQRQEEPVGDDVDVNTQHKFSRLGGEKQTETGRGKKRPDSGRNRKLGEQSNFKGIILKELSEIMEDEVNSEAERGNDSSDDNGKDSIQPLRLEKQKQHMHAAEIDIKKEMKVDEKEAVVNGQEDVWMARNFVSPLKSSLAKKRNDVNKRKLSGKYETLYQEIAMVTRNASGRPGSKNTAKQDTKKQDTENQGVEGHMIDDYNRVQKDDTDDLRLPEKLNQRKLSGKYETLNKGLSVAVAEKQSTDSKVLSDDGNEHILNKGDRLTKIQRKDGDVNKASGEEVGNVLAEKHQIIKEVTYIENKIREDKETRKESEDTRIENEDTWEMEYENHESIESLRSIQGYDSGKQTKLRDIYYAQPFRRSSSKVTPISFGLSKAEDARQDDPKYNKSKSANAFKKEGLESSDDERFNDTDDLVPLHGDVNAKLKISQLNALAKHREATGGTENVETEPEHEREIKPRSELEISQMNALTKYREANMKVENSESEISETETDGSENRTSTGKESDFEETEHPYENHESIKSDAGLYKRSVRVKKSNDRKSQRVNRKSPSVRRGMQTTDISSMNSDDLARAKREGLDNKSFQPDSSGY